MATVMIGCDYSVILNPSGSVSQDSEHGADTMSTSQNEV